MLRSAFARSPVDPLGAGAVLLSVAGLTAMFLALRAQPVPDVPTRNADTTVVVDVHHPADRHDDEVPQRLDSWALPNDLHHPADKHDQP
jgi:hypothetical protein